MRITATPGGSPLYLEVKVDPFVVEGRHARATYVEFQNAGRTRYVASTPCLRTRYLLPVDSASNRRVVAASKDVYGVWSLRSQPQNVTPAAPADGAKQVSIASAATSSAQVEEPGMAWPAPAIGSSMGLHESTALDEGWPTESARSLMPAAIEALNVRYDALPPAIAGVLENVYATAIGPARPVIFDFYDPFERQNRTVVARFVDRKLDTSLFDHGLCEASFGLVEMPVDCFGGEQ